MEAQVSTETVYPNKLPPLKSQVYTQQDIKNYLQLKNQICKNTFHIGC